MAIWAPSKLMILNRCFQLHTPMCSKSTSKLKVARGAQVLNSKNNNTNGFFWVSTMHCSLVDSSVVNEKEEEEEEEFGIMCEPCNGSGWLLCDFCNGQKTNVKSETNRIYRRCPTCKAVGYILCQKCKVFKCVTYPDFNDGQF